MPATAAAESKERIQSTLGTFAGQPLPVAARALFGVLGYVSSRDERVLPIVSPEAFLGWLEAGGRLERLSSGEQEEFRASLTRLHFLFQLTDAEMKAALGQAVQTQLFDSGATVDGSRMESYLVFAAELAAGVASTRTVLARLVRLFNKPLPMPALVLFRHGDALTLGVIKRRLNLRDAARDVLERVTLIKDIRFASPHRAHVEILFDLSLGALYAHYQPASFVKLHEAWQKTLDIQTLNRRFFIEIRNWFYWARLHARFPSGAAKDEGGDSEALIRLLTRLIFCWFLTEKGLIPNELFSGRFASTLLRDWPAADESDTQGRYYKAILQNLFFATLNTPVAERKFRTAHTFQGRNKHYGDQRYFRHVALFEETAPVEALYRFIPFLNGGLFEMLDEIPGRGDPGITQEKRVDGFSDVPGKQPLVPDFLFFGEERPVPEIAALLGESATPRARGLFRIFHDYKFTIEENTPLEEDIALDPELLGRAFENLLAAVNPETGAVARKSTGSFYTPREIVNYMIEEALVRRLLAVLERREVWPADLEERLRELVSEERESHRFNDDQAVAVVEVLGQLRILDPACGSGAFPMGLLQRLVQVLRKLDPGNERWKAAKLAALPLEMREKAEQVFREESFDYTRKLELIKDGIHGVDIQPAAIQISKLRFFLSLVIEQKSHHAIRPLPNLETKFVCANALLGLPRREEWASLFAKEIEPKERALLDVRARYFFCVNQKEKEACRAEDRRLRQELSDFIKAISGSGAPEFAFAVAAWDPYKPDRVAGYFDPETMFGVVDGFDMTIGNPPYVRADEQSEWNRRQREQILASGYYETLWEKWDLFVPFIEQAYKLLKPGGISTLIVSDAYCHSKYAQKSQNWFLKNARVLRLDFCSKLQIFEAAVHNLIYFFQNADGANNCPERRVHETVFGQVSLLPTDKQPKLTYRAFFPESETAQSFSCKFITLDQICYISVGMVVHADEKVAKGVFELEDLVSEQRDSRHSKPFVEGKNLGRWLPIKNNWLEWGTERAPTLFRRPTFIELYTVPEKLISVDMAAGVGKLRAAYDNSQLFHNHSAWSFVSWHYLHGIQNNSLKKAARYRGEKSRPDLPCRDDLEATSRRFAVKYLLGVMNSSAARDFLRAHRRSNIHLYPDDWKKLPIPDVPPEQQAPMVALVDEILTLRRANPQADIARLEAEIDRKVAELYGIVPQ